MIKIAESADKKGYLGDNSGAYHRRKLSQVIAPIQAWYGTMTTQKHRAVAAKGVPYTDVADFCQLAPCAIVQGSRLGDGIPSNLANVFVVVDLAKVGGRQVGTVADYVAMLTLLKTDAFPACRPLPSVTNLLTADCDERLKTAALSDADLAFLRGVYKTDTGQNENLARGDILREMEKSPVARDIAAPAQPDSAVRTSPAK
jgi:hypothetical protein